MIGYTTFAFYSFFVYDQYKDMTLWQCPTCAQPRYCDDVELNEWHVRMSNQGLPEQWDKDRYYVDGVMTDRPGKEK